LLSVLLVSGTVVGSGLLVAAAPSGAAGVATHLVVSAPATLGQGDAVTITVTAEDATNAVVTNYTGTVAISSSDPGFVTVLSSTLTKGKGIFTSGLFTLGNQTITATDTVTSSITGSATVDVVRPTAVVVKVTGSSLAQVTASPQTLTPTFAPSSALTDYVLNCKAITGNVVGLTLTAPAGQTITVGSSSGGTVDISETVMENQAIVIEAPSPGNPSNRRSYWVRCLPPDFPVMTATVSSTPRSGWLLTGAGEAAPTGASANYHYVMALNSIGIPVWWRDTGQYDGANLMALQNDDLSWGWGFVNHQSIYNLDTGQTSVLASNGHELQQLPDGDFLTLQYPTISGVDLSGIGDGTNQTINDCVIQEYTPQLQLVWSWSATQHMSPDESQDPAYSARIWDVYHCNSIDVDPNSSDPNNPNLLLSMRDTNAIYYIVNPESSAADAGKILWKFGGGTPIAGSPDATATHYLASGDPGFFAQHDARFGLHPNQVSIFDDGSPANGTTACTHPARGVEYTLHPKTATATLIWQYVAPNGQCAPFEGSFRRYADGKDNIVDWGNVGGGYFISEVNDKGQPILTISAVGSSYRAIKVPLTALDGNQLRQDMGGIAPQVTSLNPATGPEAGGTVVTITGRGFTQAQSVSFGSVPATSFTVNSDGSITATAPATTTTGTVVVTVTTGAGSSAKVKGADYLYTA
jgi:hypothetical protein